MKIRTTVTDISRESGQHKSKPAIWLAGRQELILAATLVVFFIFHTVYLAVPAEDSFITFRFARHLAEGYGIVWNIGEAPVEGYTNFLWMLISAFFIKLGLDVALLTQVLGVFVSLATLGVTVLFARQVFNIPWRYAQIAALMLAVSGPFATWAASSMETNLFAFLILVSCYAFALWIKEMQMQDLISAMLLLVLATLTRPEGFFVFGVLAALGLILLPEKFSSRLTWRYLAALLVFVVPFLVYFFLRYQYFGYLLPNTFYAKTGGGLFQYLRGAKYTILFGLLFGLPLLPIVAAYLWERDWMGVRRSSTRPATFINWGRKSPGLVVCGVVSIVYAAYVVYVGGDYMAMFRFFVPILPLIYLIFAQFACWLFNAVAHVPSKLRISRGLLVGAVLFTLLQSTPLEEGIFNKPWFMHGTYRGVQHERWHVARNTLVGEFFKNIKRSDEESVALLGIGIIPYISDMKVYSFHGIVDPSIAHMKMDKSIGAGFAGHEKVDFESVILRKPTYIMVDTGDLYERPQPFPVFEAELDTFLREYYELKTVWLVDTINQEAGYLHYLELK